MHVLDMCIREIALEPVEGSTKVKSQVLKRKDLAQCNTEVARTWGCWHVREMFC